jgi:hypothetical protein
MFFNDFDGMISKIKINTLMNFQAKITFKNLHV